MRRSIGAATLLLAALTACQDTLVDTAPSGPSFAVSSAANDSVIRGLPAEGSWDAARVAPALIGTVLRTCPGSNLYGKARDIYLVHNCLLEQSPVEMRSPLGAVYTRNMTMPL
jgi:hypothetical protein